MSEPIVVVESNPKKNKKLQKNKRRREYPQSLYQGAEKKKASWSTHRRIYPGTFRSFLELQYRAEMKQQQQKSSQQYPFTYVFGSDSVSPPSYSERKATDQWQEKFFSCSTSQGRDSILKDLKSQVSGSSKLCALLSVEPIWGDQFLEVCEEEWHHVKPAEDGFGDSSHLKEVTKSSLLRYTSCKNRGHRRYVAASFRTHDNNKMALWLAPLRFVQMKLDGADTLCVFEFGTSTLELCVTWKKKDEQKEGTELSSSHGMIHESRVDVKSCSIRDCNGDLYPCLCIYHVMCE